MNKILIFAGIIASCSNPPSNPTYVESKIESHVPAHFPKGKKINATEQNTIATRFTPPDGYQRTPQAANSFANYLRNFELHPTGKEVLLFDGRVKPNQSAHVAVLKIDVGKRDLQQCADAVMRLRAEYLYEQQQFENISFNFVSGFKANYSNWRNGKKISVKGNKVNWVNTNDDQTTKQSFRNYLNMVFSYASTLSLEKELKPKNLRDIQIGDVFIQGGSPGHAVLVVDVVINEQTNDKAFLLAQSYMPAQEIHILKNPMLMPEVNPWFSVQGVDNELFTPEWTFERNDLRGF